MPRSCVALLVALPVLTQCRPAVDFGHADPCPYTRLTNSADDEANLSEGRACFDRTVAEGTPITWDLEAFTVEGDPVFYRVEWQDDTYSIFFDASADTYGGGSGTDKCAALASGEFPACP